jgi:hypothetical protein
LEGRKERKERKAGKLEGFCGSSDRFGISAPHPSPNKIIGNSIFFNFCLAAYGKKLRFFASIII